MLPWTRPGLRSSRAWPPRLEPGAQAVGQGLGRRTDRGDGGVVVHAFGSYETDDTVGPLVVAVGRRNQARAHQVVESVLGAYQDDNARAGDRRPLESVAHQPEKPAPARKYLHDRREALGVEVVQARQQGRGAAHEHPAVGGPPKDLDGFEYRPDDERVVVREHLPRGGSQLQIAADRPAAEPGVEGREDLAQLVPLYEGWQRERGAGSRPALHGDDEQQRTVYER